MTLTSDSNTRLLRSVQVLASLFEQKLGMKLEVLEAAPAEAHIDGLQFGTMLNSFGLWGLRSSKPLSEKIQSEITASIHGLLDAIDRLRGKRDDLVKTEERLTQKSAPAEPDNVIPLFKESKRKSSSSFSSIDKRWMLKLDCLIESKIPEDIHKMAVELHSQSQRYALIEYTDLQPSVRASFPELMQLGSITLFVPNILALQMQEQEVLRQVMRQNTLQRPLLMVGARLPYADLRTEPSIHLEFLVMLSQAYIKLTRPFSEYKDKGLIHYFLDSLSQDPT